MKSQPALFTRKTIWVLYEASGVFTRLYRDLGYNVRQFDMQIDGNDMRLLKHINEEVHGLLAFPPCTHLAGSGARWWEAKGESALLESLSCVDVVMRIVALKIKTLDFWVVENPVGRLTSYLGKPSMIFNPNEFAGWADDSSEEAYTKKTCLWGEFNAPVKKPVAPVLGSKMHLLPPSAERANLRSKTPQGFARAFVNANRP